jgi:nucleoside-diphosphate-sugar epimerase
MRILVAGATGALGRQLVPRLVARGHEVSGMTRTDSKQQLLRDMGATPIVADALDPDAVALAVAESRPDVIVHELTAIPGAPNMRHFDRDFAQTNRLRTEGTDHLLSAGRAAGVKRFVAQSFAGLTFERSGSLVKSEDAPLDLTPPGPIRETNAAIRHVERAVIDADWTEGIVLRYGGFYGPGTSLDLDGGGYVDAIRARKFPIVGDGGGVWSFIHIEDAADATVAAIEHGSRGIYNIVDDDPATVADWLPATARALGAKPPRHVPRWFGRLVAGELAAVMMTEMRGASNAKAKRELGWQPNHPSLTRTFAGAAA